jgi:hypothetical protein
MLPGQHFQSVYQPAFKLGGKWSYAFHSDAHITDESALVTDQNRIRLYAEWFAFVGHVRVSSQSNPFE